MRVPVRSAVIGLLLLTGLAARADPGPPLEQAFHQAAWTRLPAGPGLLPAAQRGIVGVEAPAGPLPTLDHLLNGAGRPFLESVLRRGGAVFVRHGPARGAFGEDPLLSLHLACTPPAGCPAFAAYASPVSGLVVVGGEVAGGILLASPAAMIRVDPSLYPAAGAGAGGAPSLPLAGPVPEPRSWALLILGFGLVGAAARRTYPFGSVPRPTASAARIGRGPVSAGRAPA